VFPQSSVAVHVRVITSPTWESEYVIAGLTEQLSVAVALPVFDGSVEALQSIDTLAGQVITGSIVSSTVIVCVHSAQLPDASVALYVRVIVSGHVNPSETSLT
jgi:hypothetical protein